MIRFVFITLSLTLVNVSGAGYETKGGQKSSVPSQTRGESGYKSQTVGPVHRFTGGYMGGVIPLAIQTRHNVEVRPVAIQSEPLQPAIVLVDAGIIPLTILFRSASSSINVMQQHMPGQVGEPEHTRSEDEPHRLIHEVTKPIIQELHEVITPYRRVVQEIQPVQEDIQTIVARGEQQRNVGTSSGSTVTVGSGQQMSAFGSKAPDYSSYSNMFEKKGFPFSFGGMGSMFGSFGSGYSSGYNAGRSNSYSSVAPAVTAAPVVQSVDKRTSASVDKQQNLGFKSKSISRTKAVNGTGGSFKFGANNGQKKLSMNITTNGSTKQKRSYPRKVSK